MEEENAERSGLDEYLLVVRNLDGAGLYAIERVQRHLYILCPLQDWVSAEDLERSAADDFMPRIPATAKLPRLIPSSRAGKCHGNHPWWDSISVGARDPLPVAVAMPSPRRSFSMKPPSHASESAEDSLPNPGASDRGDEKPQAVPIQPQDDQGMSALSPEEAVEKLRTQYLETLYMSKVRKHSL